MKLDELKARNKEIILFGAVYDEQSKAFLNNHFRISAYIDNNSRLVGKKIAGIQVKDVGVLKEYSSDDVIVVILSKKHWEEMSEQLRLYGIKEFYVAVKDIEEFKDISFIAQQMEIDINHPLPSMVNVELCGYCNLKCVYCPFHGPLNLKKNRGMMTWDTLCKIVDQLKGVDRIRTLTVVGNGEVFLHPEWFEMTKYLVDHLNTKKLILYTNGMLLSTENVERLNSFAGIDIQLEVSIDGRKPDECEDYRVGASYDVIKKNIYAALDKKQDHINISIFNLYYPDEQEVIDQNYVIDNRNEPPEFLLRDFPDLNIVSRKPSWDACEQGNVEGLKKILVNEKPPYPLCWNPFERMAIDWRGRLLRCSCGHASQQEIGDVNQDNLLEVWEKDREMSIARSHLIEGSDAADFCSGCEMKGKNPYYVLVKDS